MKKLIHDDVTCIAVHAAFTKKDQDFNVEDVRRWHTSPDPRDPSKPWDDIGYHYVINRHGETQLGRSLEFAGAHAAPMNEISVGVLLMGGKSADLKPEFNFNLMQLNALAILRHRLINVIFRKDLLMVGHRDLNPRRSCPYFDVPAMFEDF